MYSISFTLSSLIFLLSYSPLPILSYFILSYFIYHIILFYFFVSTFFFLEIELSNYLTIVLISPNLTSHHNRREQNTNLTHIIRCCGNPIYDSFISQHASFENINYKAYFSQNEFKFQR